MAAFEGRLDVCDVLLDLKADAAAKDMVSTEKLNSRVIIDNKSPNVFQKFDRDVKLIMINLNSQKNSCKIL